MFIRDVYYLGIFLLEYYNYFLKRFFKINYYLFDLIILKSERV